MEIDNTKYDTMTDSIRNLVNIAFNNSEIKNRNI